MGIVKSLCEKLGKANLPVYTVAAVAVFKGILRPTFTMMDKKQDPETKKYAAIREGSTELIAIPTYIGLSYLTSKLAPAFSPNGKTADQLLHSTKSTLGFIGVSFAALYAIPKLCNIAMPYIMKKFQKNNVDKKSDQFLSTVSMERWDAVSVASQVDTQSNKPIQPAYLKTPINTNGGMRI